jgi:uncharacterized protein (TIGR04376 family)
MEGVKQRITQAKELLRQIQARRQEVRAKAKEAEAARASQQAQAHFSYADASGSGWNQSSSYSTSSGADPLEDKFRRWEMDEELDQLKRNLGR